MTQEKMPEALAIAQDESNHFGSQKWCYEACEKLTRQHAEIERLRAEIMKANANLFEVRKLLAERPAMNQGLVVEYQKWTGKVYSLDFMNAQDAALQSTKEQP